MQPTSRRISPRRRAAAFATVTVLTLAVSTSAGTGHLTTGSPTAAGPIALARSSPSVPA